MPGLTVLESFGEPVPSTNPYIVMLRDALAATPDVTVQTFSWRRALLGRYDIFHVHWPEALVETRERRTDLVRRVLYLALLLRLRLTRRALVRTVHNLELPDDVSAFERFLLKKTERWTTARIALNDDTGWDDAVIRHGHYRDWFSPSDDAPVRGRLLFFGRIRRYKNTVALVRAFADLPGTDVSLHVAGAPTSAALGSELAAAARADERVRFEPGFVTDERLVAEVGAAELVVLPYTEMHNSGSVLAALSLDRPVLVPDNDVNRALAAEVGEQWVRRYEPPLSAADLDAALRAVREIAPDARPDLTRRGWRSAGAAHREVFRAAVATARGTRARDRAPSR